MGQLKESTEDLHVSNEELQAITEELRVSNEELQQKENELLIVNHSLRDSEERFRSLADNIPNLAWMADAEGGIFWYNQQWYDYTGTTFEQMQGWGWQKVHHPEYVDKVTEEWSSRIKEGKPYDNIFPLKSKDGNYLDGSSHGLLLLKMSKVKSNVGLVLIQILQNVKMRKIKLMIY